MNKVHAKPSLYACYFEPLKRIAKTFGYNLVLHGSMNRDMDLIAIPWEDEVGNADQMIQQFADMLGGAAHTDRDNVHLRRSKKPHGRVVYIIDVNRGEWTPHDPEYYLDISVMPAVDNSE